MTSRMEKTCYRALVSDPSYYLETGLDSIVWRECFYKPIELERAKIKDLTKSQMEAVVYYVTIHF